MNALLFLGEMSPEDIGQTVMTAIAIGLKRRGLEPTQPEVAHLTKLYMQHVGGVGLGAIGLLACLAMGLLQLPKLPGNPPRPTREVDPPEDPEWAVTVSGQTYQQWGGGGRVFTPRIQMP